MANVRTDGSPGTDGSPEEIREWPVQVIGGKYVRLLAKYMEQLRAEDEHGNRRLYLDDVFVAYLLAFFNPSIRSLRTIEDFSQTRQAQKHLSIRKICKSTLSDFNKLADPQRLEPIIQALRSQLNRKQSDRTDRAGSLSNLLKQTVAVDGTFIPAVAEVAWAVANSNNHGATRHRARLDARLNVATWLPEAIVVPAPGQSEADSAIEHLQEGCIYLYDRGYMSFALLGAHYDKASANEAAVKSSFVVRFKSAGENSPELEDALDCPLGDEDRAAGVVSDRVGYFTSASACRAGISKIPFREVIVSYEKNGKRKHFV